MSKRWTSTALEPSDEEYTIECTRLKAVFDSKKNDDDDDSAISRVRNDLGGEVILDDADNRVVFNIESEDNWDHIGGGSFTPNEILTIERADHKIIFRVLTDFCVFLPLTKKNNLYAYSHISEFVKNENEKCAKNGVKTLIAESEDGYQINVQIEKDFATHPHEYVNTALRVYQDGLNAFFSILEEMETRLQYTREYLT